MKGLNGPARDASLSSAPNNERHLPPVPNHSRRSILEVRSAVKPFRLHNKECVQFHDMDCNWIENTPRAFCTPHWLKLTIFISLSTGKSCSCAIFCMASVLRSKFELKSWRNGNEILLNKVGPLYRWYRKLSMQELLSYNLHWKCSSLLWQLLLIG